MKRKIVVIVLIVVILNGCFGFGNIRPRSPLLLRDIPKNLLIDDRIWQC